MLFINIEELEQIQDKYFYKGKAFTGVGFILAGESLENLHEFDNGYDIGIHQSRYFPDDGKVQHIDVDYIEFTGEFLDAFALYKNKKFTGVTYELDESKDICTAKHIFKDGVPLESREWYYSGQDKSLWLEKESFVQFFEWFEDGVLKNVQVTSMGSNSKGSNEVLIRVTLNELQQLTCVWIKEDYFEWMETNYAELEFNYFATKESFQKFYASSNLSLIDSGVNDYLLNLIGSNDGFNGLSQLTLSRTSLSEEAIIELVDITTLKEIILRDRQRDLSALAKKIKQKRPDCLVRLNTQDVII